MHDSGELFVEMLPARHGDAILLGWGDGHRMLVDGGPAIAYDEVSRRLGDPLDLLVMTHIDADHIDGTILLTNDAELDVPIGEVWYNGAPQLGEYLAPGQGEILGAILAERGLAWNSSFDGRAVAAGLPTRSFSGLRLTVLGPDASALRLLADHWAETLREARWQMGSVSEALDALAARRRLQPESPFLARTPPVDVPSLSRVRAGKDRSVANASSIVLLAEYGDSKVLLAGDVTPDRLRVAVRRYLDVQGLDALPLTAFKLPHHGSSKNITGELLEWLPADRYLFSSDGGYYDHPEDTAVAKVISYAPDGAELVFNYANPRTLKWQDEDLRDTYHYRVRYPEDGPRIELPS